MSVEKILEAVIFAQEAHRGQVRKYTGEPYITHPIAVSEIVDTVSSDEEMIVAAILHDTVEDTDTTLDDIRDVFGLRVSLLVDDLTDVSQPGDGNRAIRKKKDLEHTAKASPDAKTIKLADLIHNTQSIVAKDPKFAKTYIAEKALLLEVLTEGNQELHKRAMALVDNYYSSIK